METPSACPDPCKFSLMPVGSNDVLTRTSEKQYIYICACRYHYPHHSITTGVWAYYMVELSFYWSLLISQFFDVRRSDFWEMFAHHLATVALLALSWTCNLFRIGTLVLWVSRAIYGFFLAVRLLLSLE